MQQGDILRRLDAAVPIVREAGGHALRRYAERGSLKIERKGVQDVVSVADRECEAIIVDGLAKHFADDGFLGEESGRRNRSSKSTWVIDPIDGTANFVRGIPYWCVSVGLLDGDEPVLGIIFNPVTDEFYSAAVHTGATLNGRPIHAGSTSDIAAARVGVGFSYRRPVSVHVTAVAALLDSHCEYTRLGSGALGMAMTADGRLDGYWESHINVWDVAAGLCIAREAGAWVSDFTVGDYVNSGNPILAAAPNLAARLRSILKMD